MDYVPLITYDYKLAFCQATSPLCEDVQELIWQKVLVDTPTCPPAPIKRNLKKYSFMKKSYKA